MMRRLALSLFSLLAVLMLGGCYDKLPFLQLHNNSGGPIVLWVGEEGRRKAVEIPPGGVSKGFPAFGTVRRYEITAAGCAHLYENPPMGVNFPFKTYEGGYPVHIQLEPDFVLHLMPFHATAMAPVEDLAPLQRGGFPLRPISTHCG